MRRLDSIEGRSDSETAAQRLAAARVRLIAGRGPLSLFLGSLTLRLRLEEDRSIDTMATDGRVLRYQPEFVLGLSAEELLGALVHVVLNYCALEKVTVAENQ